VIVCYTRLLLRPETVASLEAHAPHAELHDVTDDPDAYWRALARVWADGEAFIAVEHDVELTPEVLPQFAACPEPWCSFGYGDIPTGALVIGQQIGAVRFRAELVQAHPDVFESIEPRDRGWTGLDMPLHRELWRRGLVAHFHLPPVAHHRRDEKRWSWRR